jgi:ABC-2 type transport system permease protein
VAGELTGGPAAATWDVTGALVDMRRALARNAPGGSGTVLAFRGVGLALAVGTLLLGGLVRFDDPDRWVDLLATLLLAWLIGWVMGPIAVRGAGQGLRPEWFVLLPIPARRLATGLFGAAFAGFAPAVTLVAFMALPVAAARLGVLPVLVAVPAALLELVVVVLVSRVAVAVLSVALSARRGQELGGLLMAVIIALASGGWSLASVMGRELAEGPGPVLSAVLRALPSGWGPVAVAASDRSDWPLALGALAGLALLAGLLLLAWAGLLPRTMRRSGGRPPRTARGQPARAGTAAAPPAGRRWRSGAGPTGAVVAKELHTWRRDPGRTLLLLLALLVAGLQLAVPAVAFDAPGALPWVGLAAALIVAMGAANVYGDDGTAFWLTRMLPGTEKADVRGRQAAWLLVVAPAVVVLTAAPTALGGQGWAWPWVLATLPAVLGGTAGLLALVSATMPVRQKDPHRRSGPFDTGDDPTTAGAAAGQQYLMLLLAALTAVPAGVLVLVGVLQEQPVLQAAGVLVGVATGVLLWWWGGRAAARRLVDHGAELMDLFLVGPPAPSRPVEAGSDRAPAVRLPRGRAAAIGVLYTVGVVCIFPQGLVPIVFNLFGVDPEVRVWFAARYLPLDRQVLAAAGFIAAGLLAVWWAEVTRRRHTGAERG